MKSISIKTEIKKTENIVVDYGNGVKCNVRKENDVIINYTFIKNNRKYQLLTNDELKNIKINHWSKHYKLIEYKKLSLADIINFKDFNNLYYIGGGCDKIVLDINEEIIPTLIYIDESTSSIYLDIETTKEECEEIIDSIDKKYLLSSKILEIPYYNINENKTDHYTIELEVIVPDDFLKRINIRKPENNWRLFFENIKKTK